MAKPKRKVVHVKAEKGIPLPPLVRYPWNTMEIGDSFIYKGKPVSVGRHLNWAARMYGKKYTHRTEGLVVRVWRIDPLDPE